MDILNLLAVLRRRWAIVLAVLAATAGGLALTLAQADASYELRGSYLVTTPAVAGTGPPPPSDGENGLPANPYRESSQFAVRILQETLGGEEARAEIVERGGTGEFALEMDQMDPAPVLFLSTTGASAEEAERTHEVVREAASEELATRQAALQLPDAAIVDLEPLSVPSAASPLPFQELRALITIGMVGAAAAVGSALAYDNVATALRRRRESVADEPADEPVAAPDEATPVSAGDDTADSVAIEAVAHADVDDGLMTENATDDPATQEATAGGSSEAATGGDHATVRLHHDRTADEPADEPVAAPDEATPVSAGDDTAVDVAIEAVAHADVDDGQTADDAPGDPARADATAGGGASEAADAAGEEEIPVPDRRGFVALPRPVSPSPNHNHLPVFPQLGGGSS